MGARDADGRGTTCCLRFIDLEGAEDDELEVSPKRKPQRNSDDR
jgi:hypothetical protein